MGDMLNSDTSNI